MWAAQFLGIGSQVPGVVCSTNPLRVQTDSGLFSPGKTAAQGLLNGSQVFLMFRPAPTPTEAVGTENVLEGTVQDVIFRGDIYRVVLRTASGALLHFDLPQAHQPGEALRLALAPQDVLCFAAP